MLALSSAFTAHSVNQASCKQEKTQNSQIIQLHSHSLNTDSALKQYYFCVDEVHHRCWATRPESLQEYLWSSKMLSWNYVILLARSVVQLLWKCFHGLLGSQGSHQPPFNPRQNLDLQSDAHELIRPFHQEELPGSHRCGTEPVLITRVHTESFSAGLYCMSQWYGHYQGFSH